MTLSRTFGSLQQQKVSQSATALFNDLGIYRFCIAFAIIDFLDVIDFLDFSQINNAVKYSYAVIIFGFMAGLYVRYKAIDAIVAPIIFLLFFVATGLAFAVNFFILDERISYISAFISPLVFVTAIFIPPNAMALDARRIVEGLTLLLTFGAIMYLVEAIVHRFGPIQSIAYLGEVQILKSMNCLLALCLCLLTGRNKLALFVALVTLAALMLRPLSTLVLALICCLPVAFMLRFRVSRFRPGAVLLSGAMAMTVMAVAVSIPLLLYFFFDDIASTIEDMEGYIKTDVMGAQSNMAFRFAILKYAFILFDTTSFWYGSALTSSHVISLAKLPGWGWWFFVKRAGEATIHSDFVIVLVLTGILGYALFCGAFYLVLKNRFRELARRNVPPSVVVLQSISIIATLALIIYCSDEPYLSYYNHAHVVWMLLLFSEVARKSKIIDRAVRRDAAIGPGAAIVSRFRR
jgi:hypothetical protein